MVEEINDRQKAEQLRIKAEIAARLKLGKTAKVMKKAEKPKQPKGKWSQN